MVSLRVEERPTDLVMNSFEKIDRQPNGSSARKIATRIFIAPARCTS